ncbi:MAG: oxygen-independent coproporphyrinogen III oxidase [Halioglobus sp.]|nr:oxygen-independent coproporphyrinogen III oxidase [Halioglobus sp.]
MAQLPPDASYLDSATPEFLADCALATKYSCQGPRYTSYPTAPQFREDFPRDEYYNWLRQSEDKKTAPLSLYIHLPFCHDICYYCGCNKVVTREKHAARDYLRRLGKEVARQAELVGGSRPVTQMHWGGGTPNYLDSAEITELMHMLASHFRLLDRGYREYSIEVDPRVTDSDTIALLKGLGFNRISLGIQDFDPLVQKAINRIQPYQQVAPLVESIRINDFRSLSFDLIYGLPHQDRHTIEDTLRKVIGLKPDRIACYNYAHMPGRFSSQRAIDRLTLPDPQEKLLLQYIISKRLQEAGYRHIGMDHYVLPDDELAVAQQEGRLQRNFQGYSLDMAEDLLGLGVSAISQLGDFYIQNDRDLASYYALIDGGKPAAHRGCKISREDKLRRYIIMNLICDLRLDITEFNRRFGIDFHARFHREIDMMHSMEADGLLQVGAEDIQVNERGRPFLRNICMLFDAYLGNPAAVTPLKFFSATI